MNPLEAALLPVAKVLNRNIQATTPARELCRQLSGTVVAIRVRNTALTAWFIVHDDSLELATESDREPDVSISGSILTLASMAGESGLKSIRAGSLELTGDPVLADDFQRLLSYARPDIEEELSGIVGDAAAHRIGEIARSVGNWSRDARETMGENIREYLQEESRDLPSRFEVERFSRELNVLRDDVERTEARLARLEARD